MQTFLPYPSFESSARVLDRQRLCKQRLETWQVLQVITGQSKGWQQHPTVKMWSGYARYLSMYGIMICNEWIARGYKDTMLERFQQVFSTTLGGPPAWLGDPAFHASHRAALLCKNPEWYGQFDWTESPAVPNEKGSLPYVWPVSGCRLNSVSFHPLTVYTVGVRR
jgi:hypothetical protein